MGFEKKIKVSLNIASISQNIFFLFFSSKILKYYNFNKFVEPRLQKHFFLNFSTRFCRPCHFFRLHFSRSYNGRIYFKIFQIILLMISFFNHNPNYILYVVLKNNSKILKTLVTRNCYFKIKFN